MNTMILRYDDSTGRWCIGDDELRCGDRFTIMSYGDELPPITVRIEHHSEVIGGWILISPYGPILPTGRRVKL